MTHRHDIHVADDLWTRVQAVAARKGQTPGEFIIATLEARLKALGPSIQRPLVTMAQQPRRRPTE
jgi:hypothetical protein